VWVAVATALLFAPAFYLYRMGQISGFEVLKILQFVDKRREWLVIAVDAAKRMAVFVLK